MRRMAALALLLGACGGEPLAKGLPGSWSDIGVGDIDETLAIHEGGRYERTWRRQPAEPGSWFTDADGLHLVPDGGDRPAMRWELTGECCLRIWWPQGGPLVTSPVLHMYARVQ